MELSRKNRCVWILIANFWVTFDVVLIVVCLCLCFFFFSYKFFFRLEQMRNRARSGKIDAWINQRYLCDVWCLLLFAYITDKMLYVANVPSHFIMCVCTIYACRRYIVDVCVLFEFANFVFFLSCCCCDLLAWGIMNRWSWKYIPIFKYHTATRWYPIPPITCAHDGDDEQWTKRNLARVQAARTIVFYAVDVLRFFFVFKRKYRPS